MLHGSMTQSTGSKEPSEWRGKTAVVTRTAHCTVFLGNNYSFCRIPNFTLEIIGRNVFDICSQCSDRTDYWVELKTRGHKTVVILKLLFDHTWHYLSLLYTVSQHWKHPQITLKNTGLSLLGWDCYLFPIDRNLISNSRNSRKLWSSMYFFKTSSITSIVAFGYRWAISSAKVNQTPRNERWIDRLSKAIDKKTSHLQLAQLLMQQDVGGIKSLSRES